MNESERTALWTDPIVEDVRKERAALLREHGGTLEGVFRELRRAQERETGRPVIRVPEKGPPTAAVG